MYLFKLCIVVKCIVLIHEGLFPGNSQLTLMEAAGRYVRATVRTQPVYS